MTVQQIGAIASKVFDRWSWWRLALKDETQIGKSLPVYPDGYELGYFRTRSKGGQWEPVAIYPDEDQRTDLGFRNGKPVSDLVNLFHWSCRNPISYEAYMKAVDGGGFEDEPPAPAGIGDNSGEADPFDALRIEYLGEKELAEEFMKSKVTTQAQADKVAIWAKRLTAIKTKAEGLHKVEKQPHLEASRAVDDKWRDLKTEPDELAKRLKAHIKSFLQEQIRAEEDRQRKAREEVDRIRRQADDEARAAREADNHSDKTHAEAEARQRELEAQARAAEAEAEARKVNAGRTGARVSMRVEKVGVVTDYGKAATALVGIKHKDLIAVIDQLAQRAAKAGMPFDGMEIKEEERVI